MTQRKKKPAQSGPEKSIGFNEALARLIQTDPKELIDAFERNRERAEEVRRTVDDQFERLKSATRGPAKRFRP